MKIAIDVKLSLRGASGASCAALYNQIPIKLSRIFICSRNQVVPVGFFTTSHYGKERGTGNIF